MPHLAEAGLECRTWPKSALSAAPGRQEKPSIKRLLPVSSALAAADFRGLVSQDP